jgi:hypothetical protein
VGVESGTVTLSPEAQGHRQRVEQIADAYITLPDTPEALKGHLGKYGAMFARLLLVIQAAETVSDKTGVTRIAPVVSGETAKMAADLMLRFFLPHAVRFYTEYLRGQDDRLTHAEWIAGYILARGLAQISMREIKRAYKAVETDERAILEAMELLQRARWVGLPQEPRKGSTQWAVNPEAHGAYADRAKVEATRREAERLKIAEAAAARDLYASGVD